MTNSSHTQQFGKRREPVQIVIAKGSNVRSFFLNPWITTSLTLFAVVFTVTYLAATSYLVFRDDIITFSDRRTNRMRHDYEDRIAYLRSQIDKMTSRSLVDQETLETKLEIMLRQQRELSSRHEIITSVLDLARNSGIRVPATLQQPLAKPGDPFLGTGASFLRSSDVVPTSPTGSNRSANPAKPRASLNGPDIDLNLTAEIVDKMALETSIALDAVRIVAEVRNQKIKKVLKSIGVRVETTENTGLGGPFIPAGNDGVEDFSMRAKQAVLALSVFKNLKTAVHRFPIGAPIAGAVLTSRYGRRLDPFLKRPAMHSGIDYKASIGHPVQAVAHGTVINAERHGGYGKMIEIAHENGMSTRYAHLSKLLVKKGQKIEKGTIIGKVGSTGRSTGPHLHYEVRVGEHPRNPLPFIRAGKKITAAMTQ